MIISEFDDPSVVCQHNRGLLGEIRKRRLEERLRRNRNPRSARRSLLGRMLRRKRQGRNAVNTTIR
jgi:hypothetical protein